ncbi:hypothetical protein OIB37_05250 [Streptomyces sp. NBC_00820]|uniref:hypothetical protein n=1 Tax=Streptomyces sp. NBC_00820 TaxID=2975842 RepID=UPI002ED23472|nr:hypothetical protein OIB37_05250 [Streptomyces sp. NBC_00820]
MRQQIGLGRLLPLGGPEDGAWITERAVDEVLSRAACRVSGIQLGTVRVRLANPEAAAEPSVPAPWSALPPGPLRIEADFSARSLQPLPDSAEQLRQALLIAAHERLGLVTASIDLHVTDLLDDRAPAAEVTPQHPSPVAGAGTGASQVAAPDPVQPSPGQGSVRGPAALLANVAAAVPGVTRLATVSPPMPHTGARPAHSVRIEDSNDPPGRHVQVELATDETHRALDVALAVRTAVTTAAAADAPGPVTVAILVTAVEAAKG